jgi:uncharacterized protein YkwD
VRFLSSLWILAGCGDDAPLFDAGRPPLSDAGPAHCGELEPIDCAMDMGERLPLAVNGSTRGNDDEYGGASCGLGGDAIEDQGIRWTAPRADTYTITTFGSAFDTVLSLRSGSCVGREFACSDDEGGGAQSSITIDLRECETITIVVDGKTVGEVGDFVVSVHGKELVCNDGVDDDGDGGADCADPDCFSRQCPGDDLWPATQREAEWTVLELVNVHRAAGAVCGGVEMPPAPPLEMNVELRLAARLHSQDMTDQSYFSHDSLDGRTPADRVNEAGFDGAGPIGENIASGSESAEGVVAGWMESPGHCQNIMNPSFHVIGVGFALGPGGPRWTQNFGGSP